MRKIKQTPMIMSGPMVRSLLADKKTETRRLNGLDEINKNPSYWELVDINIKEPERFLFASFRKKSDGSIWGVKSPYGARGDLIWIRENLSLYATIEPATGKKGLAAYYQAGGGDGQTWVWNGRTDIDTVSCIHMPKENSRFVLEIDSVEIQKLSDITSESACREGLSCITKDGGITVKWGIPDKDGHPGSDNYGWDWPEWHISPRHAYFKLWEKIHGQESLVKNPWVWVIRFNPVHKNILDYPLCRVGG